MIVIQCSWEIVFLIWKLIGSYFFIYQIGLYTNITGSRHVTLYSPYWIVNKTGKKLEYQVYIIVLQANSFDQTDHYNHLITYQFQMQIHLISV